MQGEILNFIIITGEVFLTLFCPCDKLSRLWVGGRYYENKVIALERLYGIMECTFRTL